MELGLERVAAESFSPLFNGGSPWADYWRRSMAALKLSYPGPIGVEIDRYRAMFARPATPAYPELSAILQKNIQQVLIGDTTPEDALQNAAKAATRLR